MPVPQNAQTIWQFLLDNGYTENAAAGILGNIEQESGGNPEAGGPGNAGIIQWTPGSKAQPDQPIMTGNPTADLPVQETDMLTYNDQQGSGAMSQLLAAASPTSAADIYSNQFERPLASAANLPNREASANDVLAAAQSGSWPSATTGSTGTDATLTAADTSASGFFSGANAALKDTGSLLHGASVVLDRAFGLFAPGNGWRIVFFGTAGLAGFGTFKAWTADSGSDEAGHLPIAIGLTGITVAALFFALRPWPQTSAGPVKPGAYIADTLQGMPPPAGPSSFSASEVHLTETGLATLLALWATGKAAGVAANVGQAIGGGAAAGGILSKLWGWLKGAGTAAEEGAGAAAEGA